MPGLGRLAIEKHSECDLQKERYKMSRNERFQKSELLESPNDERRDRYHKFGVFDENAVTRADIISDVDRLNGDTGTGR